MPRRLVLLAAIFALLLTSCAGLSRRNGGGPSEVVEEVRGAPGEEAQAEEGLPGLVAEALSASSADTTVVSDAGKALTIVYDLNGDRREDAALLSVRGRAPASADATLFRPHRSPEAQAPSYHFVLEYYLDSALGSGSLAAVSLGSYKAARAFTVSSLHTRDALPATIITEFYTPRGTEEVWAVFQKERPPSLFRLPKNPNAGYESFDIDNDGIREVIVTQSRLEEGRGYETYLTLYRLDQGGFVSVATINVVRNLRLFLAEIEADLLAGRWGAGPEALDSLFQPVAEAGEDSIRFSDVAAYGIEDVLLPPLLENPFGRLEAREVVSLPVNLVCCDGALFSFVLGVRFARNPFAGEQFELVPVTGN